MTDKLQELKQHNESLKKHLQILQSENVTLRSELDTFKDANYSLEYASPLNRNEEKNKLNEKINSLIYEVDTCIKQLSA